MLEIDEKSLPLSIQKDIEALKKCWKGESDIAEDLLWCELYGSINGSQYGNEISKEVADILRKNI